MRLKFNIPGTLRWASSGQLSDIDKYLLAVGPKWAAKPMLVNSLANHFLSVQYDDQFRLQIADEDPSAGTQHINIYELPYMDGCPHKFILHIINTICSPEGRSHADVQVEPSQLPGCGTSKETTSPLLPHLDMVCVVMKDPNHARCLQRPNSL